MRRLTFFISMFVLQFLSCKDEPAPTPADPCIGQTPFAADFDICELSDDKNDSLYVTDTIGKFEVWFRAKGNYDRVIFGVGDDPRVFTAKKFKLGLNDSEIGQTIKVKMIGYRGIGVNKCFPNEKSVDTITKSFVVVCPRNWNCSNRYPSVEYPFVGKFKGFNTDEPNKEFVVTIVNFGPNPRNASSIPWDIQIYNLPNGCGGSRDNNFCGDGVTTSQNFWALSGQNAGFRSFTSKVGDDGSGSCCLNIRMWGYVSPNDRNTITIWHRKFDNSNPRKFVGRRL